MDETIIAPDAEVIAPTESTVEQPVEEVEQTIGEMSETVEDKRVVDEHVFVAEKKARKAAEKELKSLRDSIENGATKQEISDSISEIADEHNIDKEFLQKLASSIKAETKRELVEDKDKENKFETAFKSQYEIAMERAPEFKSIANPEVIKTLAIQPQNAKKTLSQILEDTYGNAITGKRTIETSTPNGGKDPEPLDYSRAEKDIEYFKEVMKDPKKKAQYNAQMIRNSS